MQDSWRRTTAALGAAAIVAAIGLLTAAVLGALDGDDTRQTVGIGEVDPDTTTTTDRTPSTSRPTTTTTAGPEVLAETTERDPQPPPATTIPAAPTGTSAPRPGAATPTTTPPPTSSPTTTTCRDSADPACGPLVWDPAPEPSDVEVVEVSVPRSGVVVGEEVTFSVDYVERAGSDAIGACASWTVRTDPGVPSVSTCEAVNHSCDRHGPHSPPAVREDRVRVSRTVTFTAPGEHEVTVGGHTATHLADGCANPYLASWTRTYVVEVSAA